MCDELAKEFWKAAWKCKSPHRTHGYVYVSLAGAAAKAFAKPRTASEHDNVHWPDYTVVQPSGGGKTSELISPLSLPAAKQQLFLMRSALDAFAVALICDVVRQARGGLPADYDVEREQFKEGRLWPGDSGKSLVDEYNRLVERVVATFLELTASPDYSAARRLSSSQCMKDDLNFDRLLGRDSSMPKIKEFKQKTAVRIAMRTVAKLAKIIHGRDLERVIQIHKSEGDGVAQRRPVRPTRQEIQEIVVRLNGCAAECSSVPLPEAGNQELHVRVSAARLKLEGEAATVETAEAKRSLLIEALDKLTQLLNDCSQRAESFETVTRDELVDYQTLLENLDDAFNGDSDESAAAPPLLPRLLADVISRVPAWRFEDVLQTTLVMYVSPRARGRFDDYFAENFGDRKAALRRYSVIFAAAQEYCRDRFPSVTRPIELHLVSRIWLLATLFRSVAATQDASERKANLSFSKALLGLVVCEHENSSDHRYDYVEAVPYWMQELDDELHDILVKTEVLAQVTGLLVDLEESMHWRFLAITNVSRQRPEDSHHLISEGSIHKDYKRAYRRNYSPNKALEFLGLKTVDLSKVVFLHTGNREKKSSETGSQT